MDSTRVALPGPPPVMMKGMRKIRAERSAATTTTKNVTGMSSGSVRYRKRRTALAPSISAAS